MIAAFAWGALASGMLLLGALLAWGLKPSKRLNAIIMALGAGLLLGSVSYDLVESALEASSVSWVALAMLMGSLTFVAGDWWLDRRGADRRKSPGGEQSSGSAPAIVMGSVLDGIPESFVLGLTVLQGGVSLPLLLGISLSNLPEGMASSSGLRLSGWKLSHVMGMWVLVVLVSALAALAGFVLLDPSAPMVGPKGAAAAQAFAAGALLTMLADTMLPEAFESERALTGALVTLGFAASVGLSAL